MKLRILINFIKAREAVEEAGRREGGRCIYQGAELVEDAGGREGGEGGE